MESEWAEAYDPFEMLDGLRDTTNEDRLWKYVLRSLYGVGADAAADIVQTYLAGELEEEDFLDYRHQFELTAGYRAGGGYSMRRRPVYVPRFAQRARAALAAMQTSAWAAAEEVTQATRHQLQRSQCAWLRCLFANPHRPGTFNPDWLNPTVRELVHLLEEESARSELMPILADALIDEGCNHEGLIEHCQSSETHLQDCWVLDLLQS